MRKVFIFLTAALLALLPAACTADEIPEETLNLLKEHCYINPSGGSKLHADPYCPTVNERYLPLTETAFSEDLLNSYVVCPVCTAAEPPEKEPSPLDLATQVMPEEEIYRITAAWEKQYGFSELWDYQINAAFSAETGTIPYTAYVFNPTMLPVMPDENAVPAEKIAESAVALAASFGSRLTEDVLNSSQVIVAEYRKPDVIGSLISPTGTWIVKFRLNDECVAWMYVDAVTGIPNYLYIITDGVSYIGEPGAAEIRTDE